MDGTQTRQIFKLAQLRLMITAATMQALLRKANFNPDQPRVPAGEPGGGRWTDGGAGSGDAARAYRINDEFGQHYVDLQAIEGYRGAHTITSHVFRSKAELLVGMGPEASRWLPFTGAERRQGKFGSYPDALRYVNETILANIETVEAVKAGVLGVEKGELITKYYGSATGRSGIEIRPTRSRGGESPIAWEWSSDMIPNCRKDFWLLLPIQEMRTGRRNL